MTKVELTQAINLRLSKGLDASDLLEQINIYPKTNTIRTVVKHSEEEKKAIMMFNKDKGFTITE